MVQTINMVEKTGREKRKPWKVQRGYKNINNYRIKKIYDIKEWLY